MFFIQLYRKAVSIPTLRVGPGTGSGTGEIEQSVIMSGARLDFLRTHFPALWVLLCNGSLQKSNNYASFNGQNVACLFTYAGESIVILVIWICLSDSNGLTTSPDPAYSADVHARNNMDNPSSKHHCS
jgi:hypothetical protein